MAALADGPVCRPPHQVRLKLVVAPLEVIRRTLQHPLTRGLSLDDRATTVRRREIIASKPLLRSIYREWYELARDSLPPVAGAVVELGSGAGFLRDVLRDAITSEVFFCPGVQLVADGQRLPFQTARLCAIVLVDVLHHLPNCRDFFAEAARCVRSGGAIVAIEPWVSAWSRLIYGRFHHEPFRPDAAEWEFPASGPLSGANQALPWILFARDRARFEQEFPEWRVANVTPMMPFRYLASGGVGLRSLVPAWADPLIVGLERVVSPAMGKLAMFAHIVIRRTDRVTTT